MPTQLYRHILSFSIAVLLFRILSGPLSLAFDTHLPFSFSIYIALLLLAAVGLWKARPKSVGEALSVEGAGTALLVVLCSDWLDRGWNFFHGPGIRGILLLITLVVCLLFRSREMKQERFSRLLFMTAMAATLALLLSAFFAHTHGALIYSDDHSAFLLRLSLLYKKFPGIPFYYPLWNGGMDARDFFATGAVGPFLITWPFFALSRLISGAGLFEGGYNLIVGFISFALLPASVYYGARLLSMSSRASSIAVVLALCSGLTWYKWALKYGTLGFSTSAALLPVTIAFAIRLIGSEPSLKVRQAILAGVCTAFMLFWAPAGLALLPIALLALLNPRSVLARKDTCIAVAICLCIIVPHTGFLWSVSQVHKFLTAEKTTTVVAPREGPAEQQPTQQAGWRTKKGGFNLAKSQKTLRETAVSTNPLLFILALPGLWLLSAPARRALSLTGIVLLTAGTILVPFKPQLELDRMLLLLILCLSFPAAQAIERIVTSSDKLSRAASMLVLGFFFCAPFSAASTILNRSDEKYWVAKDELYRIVQAIRNHSGSGRVLFSGFVLHELENGHLAPLTELTEKPLVASSQFHNLWRYRQAIPATLLARGEVGIERYFDLMAVTAVMAHEKEWRDYFEKNARYRKVWWGETFSMYSRSMENFSWFDEGQGTLIEQTTDHLTVRMESESGVLRFRYFPFLKSSGCLIEGKTMAEETELIALTGCTRGSTVTISSIRPLERVYAGLRLR